MRNEGAELDWRTSRFDFELPDLGRTAAETVLANRHPRQGAGARARGASRNAPIGSPFYGLPQAAEELGLR